MGKLSLILKKSKQFWVSFLCLTLVLPLFMDRFWEISFHWGDWWTINVCTHRPTGDTLGKTAFWNVLCYTSVTLESCSLKVFWSKMVDWLLKVIRWYHDCEILFPIRLAIMFLLWDCSKLHGVQIFWVRHWSGKKPSQQRTLMIFLSFYNDVLYNGRMIAWLSVLWREDAGCWFLSVLASHKVFPRVSQMGNVSKFMAKWRQRLMHWNFFDAWNSRFSLLLQREPFHGLGTRGAGSRALSPASVCLWVVLSGPVTNHDTQCLS